MGTWRHSSGYVYRRRLMNVAGYLYTWNRTWYREKQGCMFWTLRYCVTCDLEHEHRSKYVGPCCYVILWIMYVLYRYYCFDKSMWIVWRLIWKIKGTVYGETGQTYPAEWNWHLGHHEVLRGPPLWSSGQSFWLQVQRSRVRFPALPDFSE